MIKRIETLDYLRGLMAFSILIIHYRTWILVDNSTEPAPFFGALIVYGVSIFFLLSGATMYLVYNTSFQLSSRYIISFLIKRIFRIFPLLWLVTSLRPIFYGNIFTIKQYLLTYSGLFAFVDVTKGVARLSWSIGVELVFYSLFPLLIVLLIRKNNIIFYVLWVLSFCILYYYAFYKLDSTKTIVTEGPLYVSPINQFFLFMAGMVLAYYRSTIFKIPNRIISVVLVISVLLMAFFPIGPDLINIMTGLNRLFLCFVHDHLCLFHGWQMGISKTNKKNSVIFRRKILRDLFVTSPCI